MLSYRTILTVNELYDVHMNQGNSKKWQDDDAPNQDGGLLIHLPEENRWIAVFLAFQSQCFNRWYDGPMSAKLIQTCSGNV